MPEEPRISVHSYIDARLDEQDERLDDKMYKHHFEILYDLKELRGWFLLLSAPGWAKIINDYTNRDDTLIIILAVALVGVAVIFYYRTRRIPPKGEYRPTRFSDD